MNRRVTNLIRTIMDQGLPARVRDSKWFMSPFYRICFRGYPRIDEIINFKDRFPRMTDQQVEQIYNDIYGYCSGPVSSRPTDLNESSLAYILKTIPETGERLLDVGCGNGYFLKRVQGQKRFKQLYGCDVIRDLVIEGIAYQTANIQALPFPDKYFDVVVCNHTLEHVRDCKRAVDELKRVTKNLLIITVPCQKFFRYTLDLHVHFFSSPKSLEDLVGLDSKTCSKIDGDLVYVSQM